MSVILSPTDINECQDNDACINANCDNMFGSYSCGPCYPGYSRNYSGSDSRSDCCEFIFIA